MAKFIADPRKQANRLPVRTNAVVPSRQPPRHKPMQGLAKVRAGGRSKSLRSSLCFPSIPTELT